MEYFVFKVDYFSPLLKSRRPHSTADDGHATRLAMSRDGHIVWTRKDECRGACSRK